MIGVGKITLAMMISIIVFASIWSLAVFGSSEITSGGYGQVDFPEYWSAFHLLSRSMNPYSPEIMAAFQQTEFGRPVPIMMWNPPWLLIFMFPLLNFDMGHASQLWIGSQIVMLVVSAMLILSSLTPPSPQRGWHYMILLPLALLFIPFHNSLQFGQIGALLLLGISLIFAGLLRRSSWMMITGALLISVKPHMFFLLGVVVIWWLARERKWSTFLWGFLWLALLLGVTEFTMPSSISWWIETLFPRQNEIVPTTYHWVGPTFGGALRAYFGASFFHLHFLLSPFLAVGLAFYLIRERPEIDWRLSFSPILAISVYLAPFGWFFDQTVLLIMYLSALYFCMSSRLWGIFALLLGLQLVAFLFLQYVGKYLHEMFWYLPTLFLFWFMAYQRVKISVSKEL